MNSKSLFGEEVENINDIEVFAKDIHDCNDCPIYKEECSGGWTSDGGGQPIEPPCCSWNDDTEVYVGMYSCEKEYSPQEIEWYKRRQEEKEAAKKAEQHKVDVEDARRKIYEITGGGNTPIRYGGELCATWYCKRCNRWVYVGYESSSRGITTSDCPRCGSGFAHSGLLEDKD